MQFSVQLRLHHASGLGQDDVVNTWAFVGAGLANETNATAAALRLQDFYEGVHTPSTTPVLSYYPADSFNGSGTIKVYDITQPEPRVPIIELPITLTEFGTSDALPEEVALCLSFQAVPNPGQAQARRRGRVYLGPFGTAALGNEGTNDRPVPNSALREAVQYAAADLLAASDAEMSWAVWSRAAGALYAVDNGWIDNAWDTQRRRGLDPTSRLTFSTV